ncbi:hypothetical protein EZS27_014195 [termite gut metagenome]|uniref:Uncharacterized protein n=1 Tax=termite gut metagenome TaxID=433724 RepID=A0A5J4RWC4_9ZZZZ
MEADRCKIEIEIIRYTDSNSKFGRIVEVARSIRVDGELYYTSKVETSLYLKEKSPLRDLERWLFKKPRNGSNITGNTNYFSKSPGGFWKRSGKFLHFGLQFLHLKLQILYLKFRKLLFRLKTTFF